MLLLQHKGLTVGALTDGRVCFMGSNRDRTQGTVILSLAVIRTLLNSTADTLVSFIHEKFLLLLPVIQPRSACFSVSQPVPFGNKTILSGSVPIMLPECFFSLPILCKQAIMITFQIIILLGRSRPAYHRPNGQRFITCADWRNDDNGTGNEMEA